MNGLNALLAGANLQAVASPATLQAKNTNAHLHLRANGTGDVYINYNAGGDFYVYAGNTSLLLSANTTYPLGISDGSGNVLLSVNSTGIMDFQGTMGGSSKDPTTDAPADWVQVKIGGSDYYLPAYAET